MKATIEVLQKIEVEYELPFYSKDVIHYYKLEAHRTTIVTNTQYSSNSISFNNYMMDFPLKFEQISEEEFMQAFNEVKSKF